MSTYIKKNGELIKLAGNIVQRINSRWFLCTRSVDNGIEYYTVPQEAQEYFKQIDAFTVYILGFDTPNTTTNPKLVYGSQTLDIKDFTNENGTLNIGQLKGVFDMFTQNLDSTPEIYFVGDTHKDRDDIIIADTPPTTSTVGTLGMQYLDITGNGTLYVCTHIDTSSTPYVYTWSPVGGNVEIDNITITENQQGQLQAMLPTVEDIPD